MRTWHKGPPPHIGWWNASTYRSDRTWRWWDGSLWSRSAAPGKSAKEAARLARNPSPVSGIEWTDYWPENARVPRIAP